MKKVKTTFLIVGVVVAVVLVVMAGCQSKANNGNQETENQDDAGLMAPVYSAMLVGLELAQQQGTLQETCRKYLTEFPTEASKVITPTEQGYEVDWDTLSTLAGRIE